MGLKTTQEYQAAKAKVLVDLVDVVDEDAAAFLEAPAPDPLDPLVLQLQEFTQEMARVAENVAYRDPVARDTYRTYTRTTGQPQSEIVVRVTQPQETQEFGVGGGIAGLLFTLWLVYNMS